MVYVLNVSVVDRWSRPGEVKYPNLKRNTWSLYETRINSKISTEYNFCSAVLFIVDMDVGEISLKQCYNGR
jgi:predicted site-specific integrase-resolvase